MTFWPQAAFCRATAVGAIKDHQFYGDTGCLYGSGHKYLARCSLWSMIMLVPGAVFELLLNKSVPSTHHPQWCDFNCCFMCRCLCNIHGVYTWRLIMNSISGRVNSEISMCGYVFTLTWAATSNSDAQMSIYPWKINLWIVRNSENTLSIEQLQVVFSGYFLFKMVACAQCE